MSKENYFAEGRTVSRKQVEMEVLSNGLPAKLLMLLLTVVMSTNMSGCRGTADAADTGQPPGVVAEQTDAKAETTEKKELKQVSVKEFTENIYINGVHIKFPCTFGELCNSYDFADIQENVTNGTPVENTNLFRYSYSLYFHDSEYESRNKKCHIQCAVIAESQDKVNDSELIWLNFYPKEDHFEICGLNENSKFDDMISVLGNDYDTHGNDKSVSFSCFIIQSYLFKYKSVNLMTGNKTIVL